MKNKIKFNSKIATIVGVTSIIIYAILSNIYRNYELEKYGESTTAKIIDCKKVWYSGACVVIVEFITIKGETRRQKVTLYKDRNCALDKMISIEYSTNSNYIKVKEN